MDGVWSIRQLCRPGGGGLGGGPETRTLVSSYARSPAGSVSFRIGRQGSPGRRRQVHVVPLLDQQA